MIDKCEIKVPKSRNYLTEWPCVPWPFVRVAFSPAIKLALLWVIGNSDKNISIFSDSYSCLQAIASGKSICRPNLLLEVIGLISKYTKNVNHVWLPSHIGIKGNELADTLANAATINSDVDVNIGLELSEAYNLVDRYIVSKWQHMDQEAPGSHYRSIEKMVFTKN